MSQTIEPRRTGSTPSDCAASFDVYSRFPPKPGSDLRVIKLVGYVKHPLETPRETSVQMPRPSDVCATLAMIAFTIPRVAAFTGPLGLRAPSLYRASASSSMAAPLRHARGAAVSMMAGVDAQSEAGFQAFLPKEISEIEDIECIAMARRLSRVAVSVPQDVSSAPVATSFAGGLNKGSSSSTLPIVMLHGFDSSCLEFRRLLPKLEAAGAEAYALDVLGWGFTERDGGVTDFGPRGKREHLRAFLEQVALHLPFLAAPISASPLLRRRVLP